MPGIRYEMDCPIEDEIADAVSLLVDRLEESDAKTDRIIVTCREPLAKPKIFTVSTSQGHADEQAALLAGHLACLLNAVVGLMAGGEITPEQFSDLEKENQRHIDRLGGMEAVTELLRQQIDQAEAGRG